MNGNPTRPKLGGTPFEWDWLSQAASRGWSEILGIACFHPQAIDTQDPCNMAS